MGAFQRKLSQLAPPVTFVRRGVSYLVTDAGPLSIGWIKLHIIEFAAFRAPPCSDGEDDVGITPGLPLPAAP